jgi:molecular chaperone IbpA
MVNLANYYKQSLGFDNLFHDLETYWSTPDKYPYHNIIKENESSYVLELALAGFKKNELEVSVKDGYLTVKGSTETQDERSYLHKGIGARKFVKSFKIAETIEVSDSTFKDGILVIKLHNNIPEEKKEKKITIKS